MSSVWHFATLALVTTWWLDLVWAPPHPTRATESIHQKVMNFWTEFGNDLFVMFQRLSVCNSCVPSLKQLGVEKDNTSKNSLEKHFIAYSLSKMCKHRCNRLHVNLFFWSEWHIFMTHLPLLWIWHLQHCSHSIWENIWISKTHSVKGKGVPQLEIKNRFKD